MKLIFGSMAFFAATVAAGGGVEISLVFPRNETYAPTDNFPIIFAVRNAALARNIDFSFYVRGRNRSGFTGAEPPGSGVSGAVYDDANITSDPHLIYQHMGLQAEGLYSLYGFIRWAGCNSSDGPVEPTWHDLDIDHFFTIDRSAPELDLVAATADEAACSVQAAPQPGVVINVTDQIRDHPPYEIPRLGYNQTNPAGTCAVLAALSPTLTAQPCRVKLDSATTASMAAVLHDKQCRSFDPPADCPDDRPVKPNGAVQPLAVALAVCFWTALGAAAFLLV
ncbi:hypothetical protein QBC34DRAFT_418136 [Podospora aff. communis PSN243]|uniref:DUF7136 domain-containing protein n=1 Tax=Podospora aff. communis PSN243 TaxID=3040156 RepID=A0AAV9G1N4_9PEZI|nr:hypothetical protein QBC34DRAFT_418136 [Podospora aff. communis PSN243]